MSDAWWKHETEFISMWQYVLVRHWLIIAKVKVILEKEVTLIQYKRNFLWGCTKLPIKDAAINCG